MKENRTLHFPSLDKLMAFKTAANIVTFELNSRTHMLTCAFSEKDLEMAINEYGAKLIDGETDSGASSDE